MPDTIITNIYYWTLSDNWGFNFNWHCDEKQKWESYVKMIETEYMYTGFEN